MASTSFSFRYPEGSPQLFTFRYPCIHTAFDQADGSLVVSTGDWWRGTDQQGHDVYYYWEGGLYRIKDHSAESIDRPRNTFIIDGAIDSAGQTWLLRGEALDRTWCYENRVSAEDQPAQDGDGHLGYRRYRFPSIPPSVSRYPRLALLDGLNLTDCWDLTAAIPGLLKRMNSDPRGRVFLVSVRQNAGLDEDFLCWWDSAGVDSLQILNTDATVGRSAMIWGYPKFGPDGQVYLLLVSSPDDAVLSLDPDTAESRVYSCQDYPLDCDIDFFCVDPLNNLWFGCEGQLTQFDGETWTDYRSLDGWFLFDNIIQMQCDEIDHVYYVISYESSGGGDYNLALTIFNPLDLGSCSHVPFEGSVSSVWGNYWGDYLPTVFRGAHSIWWLSPLRERYGIYSYDHQGTIYWNFTDWVKDFRWAMFRNWPDDYKTYESFSEFTRFVGPTSDGRTFCVSDKSIIIW